MQNKVQQNHSTERALIKIQNDLLDSIENNRVTVLVMLDLSSPFDTVDHSFLLSGLETQLLSWIQSYLTNKKKAASIDGIHHM